MKLVFGCNGQTANSHHHHPSWHNSCWWKVGGDSCCLCCNSRWPPVMEATFGEATNLSSRSTMVAKQKPPVYLQLGVPSLPLPLPSPPATQSLPKPRLLPHHQHRQHHHHHLRLLVCYLTSIAASAAISGASTITSVGAIIAFTYLTAFTDLTAFKDLTTLTYLALSNICKTIAHKFFHSYCCYLSCQRKTNNRICNFSPPQARTAGVHMCIFHCFFIPSQQVGMCYIYLFLAK